MASANQKLRNSFIKYLYIPVYIRLIEKCNQADKPQPGTMHTKQKSNNKHIPSAGEKYYKLPTPTVKGKVKAFGMQVAKVNKPS